MLCQALYSSTTHYQFKCVNYKPSVNSKLHELQAKCSKLHELQAKCSKLHELQAKCSKLHELQAKCSKLHELQATTSYSKGCQSN